MDWQMPRLDGLAATCRIRRLEQGTMPRLPILGLTANALDGSRETCLQAGMDDMLSKPFQRTALAALLARHLPAEKVVTVAPKGPPAAEVESDDAVLDRSRLDSLRELEARGAKGLLARAIDKYLRHSAELLDEIRAAAAEAGAARLSRAAHTLKSSSASLGAEELARLCRELEQATAAGAIPADIGERLDHLGRSHLGASAALRRELAGAEAAAARTA
jgi:HPt (histidine-containing phosphotransfer) domain-containing protein